MLQSIAITNVTVIDGAGNGWLPVSTVIAEQVEVSRSRKCIHENLAHKDNILDCGIALALVGLPDAAVTAQAPAKIAVTGQSIVANLYVPTCQSTCPVVLLVGGSGGGIDWQDYMGAILARNGFAALALAYFGMEGLPKELDQIPLGTSRARSPTFALILR